MAHLFYGEKVGSEEILLGQDEARHCLQVLRHNVGDIIEVTSGEGLIYEGTIIETDKRSVRVSLGRVLEDQTQRPFIWLVVAPTKNQSRIEWLLEKGTELGLRRFTPLVTQHSEKPRVRKDRLERVALAAAKQSRKAWLPLIDDITDFRDFIDKSIPDNFHSRFIGFCGDVKKQSLTEDYEKGSDVIFMIGPEGDFSHDEIEMANSKGFLPLDLGPDRLRTETAGLQVIGVIYELNRYGKIF